ncbi:ATP-binding protein [Streptomyces sp. NPDC006668]|uniref:AlbA family DNA-binding domain-containing protein n=1 Tax=Streptomyces sp. NPDC006668 TaxID=3156903 RepID=UPI0033FDBD0C
MPNLAHPLFSAPADAIDADMVRGFLSLELEESFTVDYKRNIEAATDTVAAMANSYGGVVLIGVDAKVKDKNLPGDLIGVKPIDKDRLVSKMATTLDPPWWTPEVISVTVDEKLLLVVRVDADTVPRPLLHQGAIRIRLDGRNEIADRRLAQVLFQQMDRAPVIPYTRDPRFAPDNGSIENRQAYRGFPPDLVIRAATELPLRPTLVRPRLHGTTVLALIEALGSYRGVPGLMPGGGLEALAQAVNARETVQPWSVDPEHGTASFVRIRSGHGLAPEAQPLTVFECTAQLPGGGGQLQMFFDLLFWMDGNRLAGDLWVQACGEAVWTLVCQALPTMAHHLLGTKAVPTPPVELHIAPGRRNAELDVLNLDILGHRMGDRPLTRGSDLLSEDLVAVGDLSGAVTEALRNIALDWRYLSPKFPRLD